MILMDLVRDATRLLGQHRNFRMVSITIRRIGWLGLLLAAFAESTSYPHISIRPTTAFAAHLASLHFNKSLQRAASLDMAKSPDVSLRHDILKGATMKLIQKRNTNANTETLSDEALTRYGSSHIQQIDVTQNNINFTYFVREAYRSGTNLHMLSIYHTT